MTFWCLLQTHYLQPHNNVLPGANGQTLLLCFIVFVNMSLNRITLTKFSRGKDLFHDDFQSVTTRFRFFNKKCRSRTFCSMKNSLRAFVKQFFRKWVRANSTLKQPSSDASHENRIIHLWKDAHHIKRVEYFRQNSIISLGPRCRHLNTYIRV